MAKKITKAVIINPSFMSKRQSKEQPNKDKKKEKAPRPALEKVPEIHPHVQFEEDIRRELEARLGKKPELTEEEQLEAELEEEVREIEEEVISPVSMRSYTIGGIEFKPHEDFEEPVQVESLRRVTNSRIEEISSRLQLQQDIIDQIKVIYDPQERINRFKEQVFGDVFDLEEYDQIMDLSDDPITGFEMYQHNLQKKINSLREIAHSLDPAETLKLFTKESPLRPEFAALSEDEYQSLIDAGIQEQINVEIERDFLLEEVLSEDRARQITELEQKMAGVVEEALKAPKVERQRRQVEREKIMESVKRRSQRKAEEPDEEPLFALIRKHMESAEELEKIKSMFPPHLQERIDQALPILRQVEPLRESLREKRAEAYGTWVILQSELKRESESPRETVRLHENKIRDFMVLLDEISELHGRVQALFASIRI